MNRFVTLLWKCTRIKSWFFWRQCFIRFMTLLINIWFIISDGFSAYLWLYLVSESWSSSSDNIRHLCLSQPISAYLLISQSLTDSDSHKSDQTEIWTLGTFFSSSRVNAEKLRCFLPAAEKNYQSLIWRMHRRRWDITKRISRCISIESLWMQSSF